MLSANIVSGPEISQEVIELASGYPSDRVVIGTMLIASCITIPLLLLMGILSYVDRRKKMRNENYAQNELKEVEAMFCFSCGKPLPKEAVFCPSCGTKRATGTIMEKSSSADLAAPSFMSTQENRHNESRLGGQSVDNRGVAKKRSNTALNVSLIFVIIAIAVVAIGIFSRLLGEGFSDGTNIPVERIEEDLLENGIWIAGWVGHPSDISSITVDEIQRSQTGDNRIDYWLIITYQFADGDRTYEGEYIQVRYERFDQGWQFVEAVFI